MFKINRLLQQLIVIGTGVSLIACSTGSSGGGSSNTPPVISQLTIPPGFSVNEKLGGSSTLYSESLKEVAIPTNLEYVGYILPDEVNAAIQEAGIDNVKVFYSAAGIALAMPNVAYLLYYPKTSSSHSLKQTYFAGTIALASLGGGAVGIAIAANGGSNSQAGTSLGQFTTSDENNDIVANGDGTATLSPTSTSDCHSEGSAFTVTSNTYYSGHNFYALGTQNGTVCVQQENESWQTLSAQAPTGNSGNKYTPGQLNQFGFYGSGTTLLGFWQVATGESNNTIYQITGSYNPNPNISYPNNYTPQTFWNMSKNGDQGNQGGDKSITISGAPAVIESSVTDGAGILYASSESGYVYKLSPGQALNSITWTKTQIMFESGPNKGQPYTGRAGLIPNSSNSGATAVLPNNQGVFAVNPS